MRPPIKANICVKDRRKIKLVVDAVKSNTLNISPRVLEDYRQIPNSGRELSINLIECPEDNSPYYSKGSIYVSSFIGHLSDMRKSNPNMVNILMPSTLEIKPWHLAAIRQGVVQDVLPYGDLESISASMNELRNEGILRNPIKVAIGGCGKLGIGHIRAAVANRHLFSKVGIYSSRGEQIYSPLMDSLGSGSQIVSCEKSWDDLLSEDPDILYLANSGHGFPIRNYSTRAEITEELARFCKPEMDKVFQKIKGCKGLKVIWPVPEIFLWGAERAGFSDREITSIDIDRDRATTVVSEEIKSLRKEKNYSPFVSGVRWYGSHGAGWTDLSRAKCDGKPLEEVHPEFKNQLYLAHINEKVSNAGLRLMKAVERLNEHHLDEVPSKGIELARKVFSYSSDSGLVLHTKHDFQGRPAYFGTEEGLLMYTQEGPRVWSRPTDFHPNASATLRREQDFQLRLAKELYAKVEGPQDSQNGSYQPGLISKLNLFSVAA